MKKNIKELREKYISNPPEGMTSEDIRHMSEEIGRASCRERVSSPV